MTVLALEWALEILVRLYRCTKTAQTGESAYLANHWPSWHRYNELRSERPVLCSVRCSTMRSEFEHRHYWNAEHFQFLTHIRLRHLYAQILHEDPHCPVLGEAVGVKRHTLPFPDEPQSGNGSLEAIGRIRQEDERLASYVSRRAVTPGLPLKPSEESPDLDTPVTYTGVLFLRSLGERLFRLGGGRSSAKRRVSLTPGPVAG